MAIEFQNLVVPVDLDEFNRNAQLLGKGLGYVRIKADPLARFVLVVHRGEIRDAHDELALVQHSLLVTCSLGKSSQSGQYHHHRENHSQHLFHIRILHILMLYRFIALVR